jgi:hypothetical protein
MPRNFSQGCYSTVAEKKTYPHSGMKRPCDLVVLLQSWAATQNFRKPECTNCAFHMPNLSLAGSRRFDPLGGLSSYAAYHISMGQRLGAPGTLLNIQSRWKWLGDPGVKGRGPAGDDEAVVSLCSLVSRRRSLASARTQAQRRCHC